MSVLRFRQLCLAALVCSVTASAMAQSGKRTPIGSRATTSVGSQSRTTQTQAKTALQGYCPVCVIELKKWEKGSTRFQSVYDGATYLFPSAAIKKKFDDSPAKYVPVLGGDCIVCYAKMEKRIPGKPQFAALRNKRLYLFPSAKEKEVFQKAGKKFDDTDLAGDGLCSVCLVMAKKNVKGSEKFTEMHKGFRYLFPSAREQKAFRKSPEKFAKAVAMIGS